MSAYAHGAYDGTATQPRRHEAIDNAVARFGAVSSRFTAAYGMRLPLHIAFGAAFFLGLSQDERELVPVSLGGLMHWFSWLDPDEPNEHVPQIDERLHFRYRRDPPEFVTVATGDSDGSHWGLVYDLPDRLPTVLAHGWARDDGTVHEAGVTLLGAIRPAIVERGQGRDPDGRARVRAVLGWLDALRKKEDEARHEEGIGPPPPASGRPGIMAGIGPYLPGWQQPAWLPTLDERWRAHGTPDAPVAEWMARATEALHEGEPGAALVLGRELFYLNRGAPRAETVALLTGAYEALGRHQLAEVVRVHDRHRDLRSVDVYANGPPPDDEPAPSAPPPSPLEAALRADDAASVGRLVSSGALSSSERLEAAKGLLHIARWDARQADEAFGAYVAALDAGDADLATAVLPWALSYAESCATPEDVARASRPGADEARRWLADQQLSRRDRRFVDATRSRGARLRGEGSQDPRRLAVATGRLDLVVEAFDATAVVDPNVYRDAYGFTYNSKRPSGGATLLHLAVLTAAPDVVAFLVERGLDPLTRDEARDTPEDLARSLWVNYPHEAGEMLAAFHAAARPDPLLSPPTPDAAWHVGDAAMHPKFGTGHVTAVDGEGEGAKLTVGFEGGAKVVAARFVRRG